MVLRHTSGMLWSAAVSAAVSVWLLSGVAQAQGQFRIGDLVQAELRPGWMTERGTRMAALHLRLADGWKTYWRIPGEAGIAPRLDWSASQNLADVRVHWPRPVMFDQGGFRSIGYLGELVLPLELTPHNGARPIALSGVINIGVCDEVCVPIDLSLSLAMRGSGSPDAMIARALANGAEPADRAGLSAARCGVEPGNRGLNVTLRATLPRQGREEHLIMEMPGTGYWVSDSQTWRDGGDLVGQARIRAPGGAPVSFDRSRLAFTVLTADRMLVHLGCIGG
jgi:DsbC/DsbD-like thiol-disulfide interchange protein